MGSTVRLFVATLLCCLPFGYGPASSPPTSNVSPLGRDASRALPISATSTDSGWFWFLSCARPQRIDLELRLDDRLLHRITFPVCPHLRDGLTDSIQYHTQLTMSFHAPRLLVWRGYRSDADTSRAGIQLDVDVWELDPGPFDVPFRGIFLGVAAAGPDSLYMNTVHETAFGEADTTELADGLALITRPQPVKPK